MIDKMGWKAEPELIWYGRQAGKRGRWVVVRDLATEDIIDNLNAEEAYMIAVVREMRDLIPWIARHNCECGEVGDVVGTIALDCAPCSARALLAKLEPKP